MTLRKHSHHLEWVLFFLILFLAGGLRLGWPGLTEFKADEARLLKLAYEMAEGEFAQRGISSSVGLPNFPMSVWLYAIPSFLWRHPYAATLFTGLLNTLAVAGCYAFTRRYWGVTAALTATLMLAVSPWAIVFSRKIWAQNLLPIFVMGWAIGATWAFVDGKRRALWLHLLCLAIAVQIHLAAVALVPATLIFLILFRREIQWRQLGIGLLLAAATAVPFVTYLWEQRAQIDLSGIGDRTTFMLDSASLRFSAMLSTGTDLQSLAGPEAAPLYLAQVWGIGFAVAVWGILILGGALLMAGEQLRRQRQRQPRPSGTAKKQAAHAAGIIVLLWLVLPPLVFAAHNTPVFIHYFIVILPAPYIAAGVFVSRISWFVVRQSSFDLRLPANDLRRSFNGQRLTIFVLWFMLLSACVLYLFAWGMLLPLLARVNTPGGFGTPLARQLAAAETAVALLAETEATEVLVAGDGELPGREPFPAVYDTLLYGIPHRFVDVQQSALFPEHGSVVLLQNGTGAVASLYDNSAVGRTTIPLRHGEGELTLLELPGAAAPLPAVPFADTYLFANWVNPFGYTWQAQGDTAVFDLYWRSGGNPDPASYQFFNHLIAENGQRVGQNDAPAWAPWQWQAGDIVISRFALPLPETAGPLGLRTGMYRYPSLDPVPLLDIAGNPYAEAIEIDRIK